MLKQNNLNMNYGGRAGIDGSFVLHLKAVGILLGYRAAETPFLYTAK